MRNEGREEGWEAEDSWTSWTGREEAQLKAGEDEGVWA